MTLDVEDYLKTMRTEAYGVHRKDPYDLGRYIGGMSGTPQQLVEYAAVLAESMKLTGNDHVEFAKGLRDMLRIVAKGQVA
jgi:hypothetical protein